MPHVTGTGVDKERLRRLPDDPAEDHEQVEQAVAVAAGDVERPAAHRLGGCARSREVGADETDIAPIPEAPANVLPELQSMQVFAIAARMVSVRERGAAMANRDGCPPACACLPTRGYPGAAPVQAQRCPAVGKALMSPPVSAIITWASPRRLWGLR